MPAWAIPLIIQAAEALGTGLAAATAAHAASSTCGWWDCALAAGIAAAGGKLLPKQILAKGPAAK